MEFCRSDQEVVLQKGLNVIIEMFLAICPKLLFSASREEKKVVDAINKQKDEIKKQEVDVKNLVDRIVAKIERSKCHEKRGRQ